MSSNNKNIISSPSNLDLQTVHSFGDEWSRFDQADISFIEQEKIFEDYFYIFPWSNLRGDAEGFDMGCGTGRWARYVAPRVKYLHCIDPSSAIDIAKRNLENNENIIFHKASVDDCGLRLGSQDFGYSLGVLHHVPDTAAALRSCVGLLKQGAPLLLYLYYAFDNRPKWYSALWIISNFARRGISRLSPNAKHIATNLIAAFVYLPLAFVSKVLDKLGMNVSNFPLSYYRNSSFYTMRTDARDRFGTPLEKRFTRGEIEAMMRSAGLEEIQFSEKAPYWCVVGYKA